MARRDRGKKDTGGGANWMDTYGDMVTLLLCFFVLLYSFSNIDAAKWEALVGSLTGTGTRIVPVLDLDTVVDKPISLEINTAGDEDPDESPEPTKVPDANARLDLERFYSIVSALEIFIDENGLAAELHPQPETLTVILRVKDQIFFDSGDATIKPGSYAIIDSLAQLFADNMDLIDQIKVEGHTDTDPIRTSVYYDNWDLSTKRATNAVRRILLNEGVDETKLIPIGMSEYHPIASNDTPEGKSQNRRVDFVIQSVSIVEE